MRMNKRRTTVILAMLVFATPLEAAAAPSLNWDPLQSFADFDDGYNPAVAVDVVSGPVAVRQADPASGGLDWNSTDTTTDQLADQGVLTTQSVFSPSMAFSIATGNYIAVMSDGACNLYYSLLNVNTGGWSAPTSYGTGCFPAIAVDEIGNIVEVHEDAGGGTIEYFLGFDQTSSLVFQYPNGMSGTFLDNGDSPSITLTDACDSSLGNCEGTDVWAWALETHHINSNLVYHSGCLLGAVDPNVGPSMGCSFGNGAAIPGSSPAGFNSVTAARTSNGAPYSLAVVVYDTGSTSGCPPLYYQTIDILSVPFSTPQDTPPTTPLTLSAWTRKVQYDCGMSPKLSAYPKLNGSVAPGLEVHAAPPTNSLWQHSFSISP
jgi:hypothetical protein